MITIHGKDVERIILSLTNLIKETKNQVMALSRESDHRLETIDHSHNASVEKGAHGHGTGDHTHTVPGISEPTDWVGTDGSVSKQLTYPAEYTKDDHASHPHIESSIIYEREHIVSASSYTTPISSMMANFSNGDGATIKEIDSSNYEPVGNFNNSYGSPWQEIYDLEEAVLKMDEYGSEYPNLQWLGEKVGLLQHMQIVLSTAIDAKWSIQIYHNWIQQAYDNIKNNNIQDVTSEDFVRGRTTGNFTHGDKHPDTEKVDPWTVM